MDVGRRVATVGAVGQACVERVLLAHVVAGGAHRAEDRVGFSVAADVSEGAGDPARDHRMPAFQQAPENGGRVALRGQDGAHGRRLIGEDLRGRRDQRRLGRIEAKAAKLGYVLAGGGSQVDVEHRGPMQEPS